MSIELLKKLLEIPAAFEGLQWLVGAPRCHRLFIERYLAPRPGERILDLGCGTGAAVFYLPENVSYVGVDISPAYIERAKEKHDRSRMFLVADITTSREPDGVFDRALSFGVLHHISDDGVKKVLKRVTELVKPGGIYATIDPCIVEEQNPIARMLVNNDRGQHVRTLAGMKKVFDGFGSAEFVVASDMLHVPYTFVISVLKI